MNFREAWALLLEGKRIRRASWDRGFYWYRHEDKYYQFNPDEPAFPAWEGRIEGGYVNIPEATATDWEEQ